MINGTKLSEMMLKVGKRVNEISGQVKSAIRSQRFSTGISFVAGVVSTVLASLVYSNLQWILQTANVWATLLGILVLSVLFFWLRDSTTELLSLESDSFFAGMHLGLALTIQYLSQLAYYNYLVACT